MNNELNGAYLEDFNIIKKYVEKHCQRGTDRDEALQSLRAIYLDAQEGAAALEEIRGESAEEYAKEIASALPAKKNVQWQKVLKSFACVLIAVVVCLCMTLILLYFTSDSYAIHSKGISFLNANPQKFIFSEQKSFNSAFYPNSSFASYFCFNDDNSVTHGGYANNYGVFFENIEFSENYESFSLDVKVCITSYDDNTYELNTPVKPVFDTEGGELLYFIKCPVTAQIGDCDYAGTMSDCYVDSFGCVRFHINFILDSRVGNTDPMEYVKYGKPVNVFFERIFALKWRRISEQDKSLSFENLKTFPEQRPVYDTEHVVYTTKDNCVTVTMDLVVDPESEKYIEIVGNDLSYSATNIEVIYDYPSYSYIDKNGAAHRKLHYSSKDGKMYTDEAVFIYGKQ